ncbi:MAG: lipopolysaccharide heptosyltransferase I [Gammaproteobacteria bacterium]|nr:lipopolysaccharide heptosyltransferase I [Gammaproteobacteria bacterium]
MKILIIKTSSMGDILHTFPALTDAGRHCPGISFDWVVEEAFADIPKWHPLVDRVIPVSWRRIRKNILSREFIKSVLNFKKALRERQYDYVIDAQSLIKSAMIGWFARGTYCGYTVSSSRESLASLFYQKRFKAPLVKEVHAIVRLRTLFSSVLGYPYSIDDKLEYDIHVEPEYHSKEHKPYVLLLHGTTWETKHWPERYWMALSKKIMDENVRVKLLWGNEREKARALRIAEGLAEVEVMPKMTLRQVAVLLAGASAAVAVDTGFAHLSAALATPTVSLYGPTDPHLTGAQGKNQVHMRSGFACSPCLSDICRFKKMPSAEQAHPPCFIEITPERVFEKVMKIMRQKNA